VFTIKGGVRAEKSLESKAVVNPGAFFADALRTNLASHGITIAGQTKRADKPLGGPGGPPADQVVATHVTPLRDILWRINKNSQNLFAEAMCKYLGRAHEVDRGTADARGSWEAGGSAVKAFLAGQGIDPAKYAVVDGSGLARGNRVTARGQTDLLRAMSTHRYAAAFGQSLAVAGVDGTIGKRSKDIAGRVFAKTGYIGGVRALSGYVHTREGQWLAFSIIYNQIPGSVKPYEDLQDDACRLMVEWPHVDRAVLRSATQPATPATRPATAPAR
jgi:D-alanyl-D-alanine carboxypeptidase/D-alanyl-D-alanine-endopeptidase (penicillin-binding protein 4)